MESDNPQIDYRTPAPAPTPRLLVAVAWLVVGIPAAWGVTQTVKRSLDLFRSPPAALPTMTNGR